MSDGSKTGVDWREFTAEVAARQREEANRQIDGQMVLL